MSAPYLCGVIESKMRTVVLLGLTAIADAINPEWITGTGVPLYGSVLIVSIVTDVTEFLKNNK